jgi:GTP-binding protein
VKPESTTETVALPLVALVGRPNVGKSTLFNRLTGRRQAIVDSKPGSTRDRAYGRVEWQRKEFSIVDTGGLSPGADEHFLKLSKVQADVAIGEAALVILLVDAQSGLLPDDQALARKVRSSGKPVLLVINKAEASRRETNDFARLGFGEPFPVSAEHNEGIGDLLDLICKLVKAPEIKEASDDARPVRVALVGRTNVGKSSMLNRLVGEERSIVSPVSGTTRDAVDSEVIWQGKPYLFVDTAGIRKVRLLEDGADHVAVVQAKRAIDRAEVCVLMVSAEDGMREMDATIAGLVQESGRAVVVAVNKWDLAKDLNKSSAQMREDFSYRIKFLEYAPVVLVSAKTGMGRKDLFTAIDHARIEWSRRIPTGPLNRCLQNAVARNPIRFKKGAEGVNLLYAAQIRVDPPTFTLSVNREGELHFSSERFLINCLRKEFGFEGSPIRIWLRVRRSRSGPQSFKMRKAVPRPRTDGKPSSGKDMAVESDVVLEAPKTRIDKKRARRS